ncbi:Thiol-disulfide oxidoreductase ResA [Pseudobythopirellula maris]|uniref:Thiol-disulfide oxidoreductase ResA n=1 Tax=Pseudobythopirellula maris TaxID=2527991 RepID=A0A5C5ZHH4_9BACT|nr:redoxin domain-containing protein [Pseudobythopirellula maris]TWT86859.1 Thiol-disulfide oxidoreductase ResA [Pseudobythopirellula maris]
MTTSLSLPLALFHRLLIGWALVFCAAGAWAQQDAATETAQADSAWQPPQDPRQWLGSEPLTPESLKGKGVILCFFDEESEEVDDGWPAMLALAAENQGKPVIFIAVSSGTEPRELARYVGRHRITWPVILDYDRSFESRFGFGPINDRHPAEVRVVNAEGKVLPGALSDMPGTIEKALEGAAWRVDPTTVPQSLLGAWRDVEFGSFASAAGVIRRTEKSRDEAIKAGGALLLEAVNKEMNAALTEAIDAFRSEQYWETYKKLDAVQTRFDGYEFPHDIEGKLRELAKRDDVKEELNARRTLEKAVRTAMKGSSGALRRARGMLERIVNDASETEAADRAREMLSQQP